MRKNLKQEANGSLKVDATSKQCTLLSSFLDAT
jgi:hypothetical protein